MTRWRDFRRKYWNRVPWERRWKLKSQYSKYVMVTGRTLSELFHHLDPYIEEEWQRKTTLFDKVERDTSGAWDPQPVVWPWCRR